MLRILFVEAFIIWFIGFIVTGLLGVQLLVDCFQRTTSVRSMIALYIVLGFVLICTLGSIIYIFIPLAITNIQRISKLENPKFYQCYRLRFYVYLICFDCVIALIAEFITKTFISTLILGSIDCYVSLCLGGTLFVYLVQWDNFNKIINNEESIDVLNDSSKSNYHLLIEDEEATTTSNPINNISNDNDEDENKNPPAPVLLDGLFGWVKYL